MSDCLWNQEELPGEVCGVSSSSGGQDGSASSSFVGRAPDCLLTQARWLRGLWTFRKSRGFLCWWGPVGAHGPLVTPMGHGLHARRGGILPPVLPPGRVGVTGAAGTPRC